MKKVSVFPQPATDRLIIRFDAVKSETIKLQLFNTTGAMVKEMQVRLQKGNNQVSFENLSQLATGVYALKTMIAGEQVALRIMIADN